jgi:hypothetical protein
LIARQAAHEPRSLADVADTHPALVRLVDRAIEARPEDRYQSAAHMAAAVRECLASLGVVRRPALPEPQGGWADDPAPARPSWNATPPAVRDESTAPTKVMERPSRAAAVEWQEETLRANWSLPRRAPAAAQSA